MIEQFQEREEKVKERIQELVDKIDKVRLLCDVADKYSDGFLRFTVRNNVEFLTPNGENVEPMITAQAYMDIVTLEAVRPLGIDVKADNHPIFKLI